MKLPDGELDNPSVFVYCTPNDDGKYCMWGMHEGNLSKKDAKKLIKSAQKQTKETEMTLKPWWRFFNSISETEDFFKKKDN